MNKSQVRNVKKELPGSKPFAEVIESFLDNFLAQCWKWDQLPSFGSLVSVKQGKNSIIGVVTQIQTGSMDPVRYPFPYQKTEEELREEQPQIFEFLKTTFRVQVAGHIQEDKMLYSIPSNPCKIHSFVGESSQDEARKFFSKTDFLHPLFAHQSSLPNLDELLLAMIKQASSNKLINASQLNEFCNIFSLLTGNDYRRLKLFLSRIEGLVI